MHIVFVYIINIIILAGVCYWYYRRYRHGILKTHYWPALILKIVSGILLGLLFSIHYSTGDTLLYYEKASELANLDLSSFIQAITAGTVPSQPVRAIYFVRLVAAVKWLTYADYWLLTAYFSVFSFLGCTYLTDKLTANRKDLGGPALIAFFYLPSVVFWSSGLLKESLVFGSMTFLLGTYFSWYKKRKLSIVNFLVGTAGFIVVVFIKYYIAAALIPSLFYLALYHLPYWEKRRIFGVWSRTFILIPILLLPILIFLSWLSPNLNYDELWSVMQWNHQEFIRLSPNGAIHTLSWFDNKWDVIVNIPYLWFSGIFRPLLGENLTFPAVLSSLENTFLLLGAIWALYHFWKKEKKWEPELLAVLGYVSLLSVFLSYAAPNFGTLARFKIYFIPFVVLMISSQIGKTKFLKKD